MKKEKIIYRGPKAQIAVTIPFGVKSKSQIKEIIFMKRGEIYEMPENEAQLLCKSESCFEIDMGTRPVINNEIPKETQIIEKKVKTRGRPKKIKVSEDDGFHHFDISVKEIDDESKGSSEGFKASQHFPSITSMEL